METLRTLVAALGSPGAAHNAERALRARQAEDRAIDELRAALARRDTRARPAAAV